MNKRLPIARIRSGAVKSGSGQNGSRELAHGALMAWQVSSKMVVQNQFLRARDLEGMREQVVERIARHQSLLRKHRKIIRSLETRLTVLETRIELLFRTGSN